jgi:hypothetical protein
MNRSALKMLAAITILLTLAGCASLSDMNRMDAFDETVKTYEKMVFWSEFDAALAFKEPREESVEQPDMNSLKKVRITSYKVKRLKASADKSEVQQFVEIGYYRMDDVTVKTIIDQQLWVYNNDAQRWYIRSDLPAFD